MIEEGRAGVDFAPMCLTGVGRNQGRRTTVGVGPRWVAGGGVRFTAFSTLEPVDIELPEAVLGFTKKKMSQASFHHLLGPFWPQNHKFFRDFFRYAGSKDALTARMLHLEKNIPSEKI
jgi:hypothetical protein